MIRRPHSTLLDRAATLAAVFATAFALASLLAAAQGTDTAAPMTPDAATLKISATPTLIFADGTIVPDALPAERLESELRRKPR